MIKNVTMENGVITATKEFKYKIGGIRVIHPHAALSDVPSGMVRITNMWSPKEECPEKFEWLRMMTQGSDDEEAECLRQFVLEEYWIECQYVAKKHEGATYDMPLSLFIDCTTVC